MIFARDVANPEGPVLLGDGSWAVTEMDLGSITEFSADGSVRWTVAKTGRPNGLALDTDGNLWVAESEDQALLRVSPNGEITTIARGPSDLPFLWPNDLCFGPDGALYMTDSGVPLAAFEGIDPPEAAYDVSVDGRVYRIDPVSGECEVLDRGLQFANGIAWGPGGHQLYVSETLTGNIYRYKLEGARLVGERNLFANVMRSAPKSYGRTAGPDGMAFDEEGRLYVTVLGQGDIAVVETEGDVRHYLEVPGDLPTNVAFAGAGERRLLLTEGSFGQLVMVEVPAPRLDLFDGNTTGAVPASHDEGEIR
ncbi:MAG: SMP-30/gluconolactonase/LRE family protein [Gammaproteobacteria bacterium]|nr:SMP-30/gluconolactonase/LRE family protein [Gammaproteobacteria bacterium]